VIPGVAMLEKVFLHKALTKSSNLVRCIASLRYSNVTSQKQGVKLREGVSFLVFDWGDK
jgi:hypothetical protein